MPQQESRPDCFEPKLVVVLGEQRFLAQRPWGDIPPGMVIDVAVNPAGNVLVLVRSDPLSNCTTPRIIELDGEGKRVNAWGETLIADAHMLSVTPDGRVFVVDRDSHEVIVCSSTGKKLFGLGRRHLPPDPFNHPTGVAVAQNGDIYVADGYANSRVHRFDAQGNLITAWGSWGDGPGEFVNPHAVWPMRDGRIVVVDRGNDRLQFFQPDGTFISMMPGFRKPLDVWGDEHDNLYVSDGIPTLTLITATGEVRGRCRPVLNAAHGLWVHPDGRIFLAEPNPSRVTCLVPIQNT